MPGAEIAWPPTVTSMAVADVYGTINTPPS